jgi:transcriptional regulator with XRE-family HTH domain
MTQRKSSEDRAKARAIGRRIRNLRGNATQLDFASMFGITRSALANYEMGRSKPPMQLIESISKKMGMPIEVLAGGPEPIDYEETLKGMVGDGSKITDDEWAIVRLLRVAHPDDVLITVQSILHGFEKRGAGIQLMDPQTMAMDLARLYVISNGDGRYDRGVSGANVVQLAKALAKLTAT